MRSFQKYNEICKYFSERKQRDTNVNEAQKQLRLHDLGTGEYLNNKNALWIDFRTIDKNALHGISKKVGSGGAGITLQIERKAESAEALSSYIYLIMDAQWNSKDRAFVSAIFWKMLTILEPHAAPTGV